MRRPTKQTHRALFLALQADAKEYPGGIRAIAAAMGVNGNTLANGLNPDHEAPAPSFSTIIEIITLAQARRAIFSLAQIVGQVPMDIELEAVDPKKALIAFFELVQSASRTLDAGSTAAKDGHFCLDERRQLEPLLLLLMKTAAELLQAIRSKGI
ncbi:MAG: phage regulatory CII family protein [Porticoccaceae bacterium]